MTKCPQCGYQEIVDNKPRHTHMNEYVNSENPKETGIFNHFDKEISVGPEGKQVKWVLKSVFDAAQKAAAAKTPTPAAK